MDRSGLRGQADTDAAERRCPDLDRRSPHSLFRDPPEQHHSHGVEDLDAESRGRSRGLCPCARARHGALFLHLPRSSIGSCGRDDGNWRLGTLPSRPVRRQLRRTSSRSCGRMPLGRLVAGRPLDVPSAPGRRRFSPLAPAIPERGAGTADVGLRNRRGRSGRRTRWRVAHHIGRTSSELGLAARSARRAAISAEGFAFDPTLSADGAACTLLTTNRYRRTAELTVVDIAPAEPTGCCRTSRCSTTTFPATNNRCVHDKRRRW